MTIDLEQIIREYLPDVIHMSLATCKDGKPWVCEVHYAFDEDLNLYYRSTTARRHSQEIALSPNVAGNIVKQVGLGEPCKGVVDFEGTAKLLQSGDELDKAFAVLSSRLGIGPEKLEESKDPAGHQFYKITVTKWAYFGILEEAKGAQKYQLDWNES